MTPLPTEAEVREDSSEPELPAEADAGAAIPEGI
jgi:hypothetical protein